MNRNEREGKIDKIKGNIKEQSATRQTTRISATRGSQTRPPATWKRESERRAGRSETPSTMWRTR